MGHKSRNPLPRPRADVLGASDGTSARRGRTVPSRRSCRTARADPAGAQDPGDDDSPLAQLRADIGAARGKAVLTETTAAGYGEGQASAPHKDWVANRLGPNMPTAMVQLADAAFSRMVAACGASVSLFTDSDGTAQREALRRWHMGTVRPLARLLEHELTLRLETEVRLRFDPYSLDVQGRAAGFAKMIQGGVPIEQALAASGLLDDG